MKNNKLLSLILIITLTLLPTSYAFSAADQPYDALSMTGAGNQYIYSDNPEQIDGSQFGTVSNPIFGRYTISQKLTANVNYDAEFYHYNSSGMPLRVGVVIANTNSTAASVRLYNRSVDSRPMGTGEGESLCSSVITNYRNYTGYNDVSIPANSVSFVLYKDINAGNLLNGKLLFKPLASNLYCKIVFIRTDKLNYAISVPKALPYGSAQTTGFFPTDARSVSYNYNTGVNKAFYLGVVNSNYNQGEYESTLDSTTLVGSPTLWGNYGIAYNMLFSNAAGKTLRIKPDWASLAINDPSKNYQAYSIKIGTELWKSITINKDSYYDLVIPTNQNIQFILPGSNIGNVYFKFIN